MSLEVDKTIRTDVIVVGAGAAGIRAAIAAKEAGSNVTLLEKGDFTEGGSSFTPYAKGWGYRAAILNTVEDHFRDIMDAGLDLTDKSLAKKLASESPDRFEDLKSYGIHFKREKNEELFHLTGCFGQRSYAMVANRMKNIKCTFYNKARHCSCNILDNASVLSIRKNKDRSFSALVQRYNSSFIQVNAKSVVLATGGASSIYSCNLNQPDQVGDGYLFGLDLGAKVINMEFIQFIYGIIRPKKTLIPQALFKHIPRIFGPGEQKNTFIKDYLPSGLDKEEVFKERSKHGPFSTRNISKYFDIAVFNKILKQATHLSKPSNKNFGPKGVIIDLSELERTGKGETHLKWLKRNQIDPLRDKIYIAPCAHAFNGGLHVNTEAETDVSGLFAAGEAIGGPHGADRLGGDAMAATQVFGRLAGLNAAKRSKNISSASKKHLGGDILTSLEEKFNFQSNSTGFNHKEIRNKVRSLMWKNVGIVRKRERLIETLNELKILESEFFSTVSTTSPKDLTKSVTTEIMLNMAKLITKASLMRKESRGPHYREDYPEIKSEFSNWISIKADGDSFDLSWEKPNK